MVEAHFHSSLAKAINGTLNISIFSQFFGSFLVLCLSLFQLLKQDVWSSDFFATIIYLITMTVQTFIYCWYGNEVKLKVRSTTSFINKVTSAKERYVIWVSRVSIWQIRSSKPIGQS